MALPVPVVGVQCVIVVFTDHPHLLFHVLLSSIYNLIDLSLCRIFINVSSVFQFVCSCLILSVHNV